MVKCPDVPHCNFGESVGVEDIAHREPSFLLLSPGAVVLGSCDAALSPLRRYVPVSRFECVSGLSVYPVEIRSVNNLSSSENCSTDYCQPV